MKDRLFFSRLKKEDLAHTGGPNRAVRTCLGRESPAFKEIVDFLQLTEVHVLLDET